MFGCKSTIQRRSMKLVTTDFFKAVDLVCQVNYVR